MNPFTKIVFILTLTLISATANASIITWDFEFEVSFVEDRTNGGWLNDLSAGDTIFASLSFDDNVAVLDDNSYQTVFDGSNIIYDIPALTSDVWLKNLAPNSWVNHSKSREGMTVQSAYSIDNTLVGEINWEALIFSFLDYDADVPYTSFPTDWGKVPVGFTYHRDLDANSSGSEIYITGQSISATQRLAVPEPTTALMFLLAACVLISRRLILK